MYLIVGNLFDFASRDIEEGSGVLAWLLFGTKIQCSHTSLCIHIHFQFLGFPTLTYFVYIEIFISSTKDLSTNYEENLDFHAPKFSLNFILSIAL